jgi:hypothetical protein
MVSPEAAGCWISSSLTPARHGWRRCSSTAGDRAPRGRPGGRRFPRGRAPASPRLMSDCYPPASLTPPRMSCSLKCFSRFPRKLPRGPNVRSPDAAPRGDLRPPPGGRPPDRGQHPGGSPRGAGRPPRGRRQLQGRSVLRRARPREGRGARGPPEPHPRPAGREDRARRAGGPPGRGGASAHDGAPAADGDHGARPSGVGQDDERREARAPLPARGIPTAAGRGRRLPARRDRAAPRPREGARAARPRDRGTAAGTRSCSTPPDGSTSTRRWSRS